MKKLMKLIEEKMTPLANSLIIIMRKVIWTAR